MTRWEYCRITVNIDVRTGKIEAGLAVLAPSGQQTRELQRDKKMGDNNPRDAASRCMAQLGEEGWEMAGISTYSTISEWWNTYFFKRPVE